MKRLLSVSLILLVVVIGGIYYFWSKAKTSPSNPNIAPVAANVLDETSYRQAVIPLLHKLGQSTDISQEQLNQTIDNLASLAVDSSLKDDHLLLFSSLDALRQYVHGSKVVQPSLIRQRLQLFAEHRGWAQESIALLVSQLPTI